MWFECITVLFIFGLTPLLNKHILNHISVETFILFSASITFLFIISFFAFFQDKLRTDLITFSKNPHLYGYIILTTLLVFVVADYLYLYSIQKHDAHIIVPIIASYPLITFLYSYFFTKESITSLHAIGCVFVVTGIVLLNQ
jgi:drug/metabolite transporter (DMT)-like permease